MFLAKDVVKITGVNRQRLQAWMQEGLISPSVHVADGHGDRNIWNDDDVYKIALFKNLVELGLQRKPVSRLLTAIPDLDARDIHACFLIFIRKGEKISAQMVNKTDDEINRFRGPVVDFGEVLRSAEMLDFDDIFVINFEKIKSEIHSKIIEAHQDFFADKTI